MARERGAYAAHVLVQLMGTLDTILRIYSEAIENWGVGVQFTYYSFIRLW
jgi:hypothetical protein